MHLGSRVRLSGVAQPGFDGKQGFLSGYQDLSGFYQVTLGAILHIHIVPLSPARSLLYSRAVPPCSIILYSRAVPPCSIRLAYIHATPSPISFPAMVPRARISRLMAFMIFAQMARSIAPREYGRLRPKSRSQRTTCRLSARVLG